jgi:hypothetical protein
VHDVTVTLFPKLQLGKLKKLLPVKLTVRPLLPSAPLFGLTPVSWGAATELTVIFRIAGLGSVFPALSVTVNTAVYVPAFAKVTDPGFASELVPGFPPRNTHEYAEMGPVPVPAKFTDCPGAIVMSEAGLVIDPFGAVSVGVLDTCRNFATEGTPELFMRKIM